MSKSFDAVIAGAGIVGAACALELAKAGLRVGVVEPHVVGGGATAAGMGHVVVMDDSEAQFALTHYSQQLWEQLAEELPASGESEQRGTIWVAADEEEMQEVRRKHSYYGARGVSTEILDSHALAETEPNLRPGLPGGLLVPSDSVVYPPCVTEHLMRRAQEHGAVLLQGSSVTAISENGVRLSDGTIVPMGLFVNAAGSWSPALDPGIEVKKRKGHLLITDRYPGFVHHQLVELGYLKSAHAMTSESVAFNAQPRSTGQMLIGSSRQFGAEGAEVEAHMLRKMLARACEYMPGLARLSTVRTWTGFRAATPDKLPLIGPSRGRENHYLATGHEGLGITTSLGTAKLLADQILKRPPAIPVGPYLPSRPMEHDAHA